MSKHHSHCQQIARDSEEPQFSPQAPLESAVDVGKRRAGAGRAGSIFQRMHRTAANQSTLGATLALGVLVAVGMLSAHRLGALAAALAILSSGLVALIIHREIRARRQAQAGLLQAQEELEERVILRTAELNTANVALQSEILDRQRAEEALREAHSHLEARVTERTRELAGANDVLHREIIERRRIAEALKNSRSLYHSLIENLPVHVWRTNLEGRFTFANEHLCDFLGVTQEDFLGRDVHDFFEPAVALKSARDDRFVIETGDPFEDVEFFAARNGRRGHQQVLKTAFHDAQGRVLGVQGISWDVTARRKAEEEMRRIQAELRRTNRDLRAKNLEIQNFYHTLSHELKTPLTAAREFVAIVRDGLAGSVTPQQREYLGIALESCNQLRVCLNDLLDAARLETGKLSLELRLSSPGALARRAVTTLQSAARDAGQTLICDTTPDLPDVMLDEHRITQVLTNLIGNALKFTPAGGRVEVQVSAASPGTVECSVTDNGRGIPADQLEQVFDRLHQVKAGDAATGKGIGLGLYICRELVRLHGGDISVSSEPGAGSTFRFTLPVTPANPDASATTSFRRAMPAVAAENSHRTLEPKPCNPVCT